MRSNQRASSPRPSAIAREQALRRGRSCASIHASTAAPRPAGSAGNRFGAVQRPPGAHGGVVGGQLGAEVEALLVVGPARRQLAAEREPAPPRRARRARMAMRALSSSGWAKNARASRSRRVRARVATPWPVTRKKPNRRQARVDRGRHVGHRGAGCADEPACRAAASAARRRRAGDGRPLPEATSVHHDGVGGPSMSPLRQFFDIFSGPDPDVQRHSQKVTERPSLAWE